jgi:hypothetical protein
MTKKPNFETLLIAVCVGHGYCGSVQNGRFVHVTDFIPERGQVTAEEFVDWVFMADGNRWLGDVIAMRHRETFRSYFIAHMGSNIVDSLLFCLFFSPLLSVGVSRMRSCNRRPPGRFVDTRNAPRARKSNISSAVFNIDLRVASEKGE